MRLPRITKPHSKLFALLALFVAGSALSIVTSLVTPDRASAITNAQKDYCVEHYGEAGTPINVASTIINMQPTTKADWTDNKCSEICTTQTRATTGIIVTVACDRDKVPSEDAAADPNDSATTVLKTEYSAVAVSALCGSDLTCASRVRGAVTQCVDTVTADASGAEIFPDVDTDALANCVNTKGVYTPAEITKLKGAFGEVREDITAKAQAAQNAAGKEECEKQEGYTWNDETNECEAPESTTTCGIEGVGWIACPAMTAMAQLNDSAFSFLSSNFLTIDSDLVGASRDAWAKFRDIANILFVVAILVVVYSQLTSVGISNYGIKKLLPKIIVAAVLVNVSFIVCQIAVDLSNILGYGINKFFVGIPIVTLRGDSVATGAEWVAVIGSVLALGVGIALAISVPVLLSALLAIGLIVMMLVARKALIVLLIVIAPLAFVAYLLPNTEQWFRKWLKMFSTLLLLFPIIGLVYGASQLASGILYGIAKGDLLMRIVALGAGALPFFVVPGLLKGSLNAAGAIGAKAQGLANKAGKRVGGKVKDTSSLGALAKQHQRATTMKRAQVLGGTAGNRVTRAYRGGINRMTGNYGSRISAQGASTALGLRNEDVENEQKRMMASWQPHEELDRAEVAYAEALKADDDVKARAAQKILLSKGGAGAARIRSVIQAGDFDASGKGVRAAKSDLSAAGLKGKDAGLNAWSYDSDERSLADVDKDARTYTGLTDAEMSSQTQGSLVRAANATHTDTKTGVTTRGIDQKRATAIMGNKDLHGNMTADSKSVIDGVNAGVVASPTSDPDADIDKGKKRREDTKAKKPGT